MLIKKTGFNNLRWLRFDKDDWKTLGGHKKMRAMCGKGCGSEIGWVNNEMENRGSMVLAKSAGIYCKSLQAVNNS